MIRVYTASTLKQAPLWRKLHETHPHIYCHARWLKHMAHGTPDTPEQASWFWQQDEEDVRDADALVAYADQTERLRGGLVEVGMAIAFGVPVIVVGAHFDCGTWQYHPAVTRVRDLDEAVAWLKVLQPRRKTGRVA